MSEKPKKSAHEESIQTPRLSGELKNYVENPGSGKQKRLYNILKRCFDVTFSILVLMIGSPIIMIGALAVRLTSPGPIYYRAKRAGLGGRPLDMLKLRTMYIGTDTGDRRITDSNDDRITPVGMILRVLRIDELPQFWNVLKGNMSIVGPRPEDWDIVQEYYTPEHRLTLNIRPGITSLAAVRWYPDLTYHDPPPSGISIQDWYLKRHLQIQLSEAFRYMEKQSLLFDLKVIGQTIFCLIKYSLFLPKQKPLSINTK